MCRKNLTNKKTRLILGVLENNNIMKTINISIKDSNLANRANELAKINNKRLKNWQYPKPVCRNVNLGEIESISFRYKGQHLGRIGYNYIPIYSSYLKIKDKYRAEYITNEKVIKLKAPKGTEFDIDGSLILTSDFNCEYHPTLGDIKSKNFGFRIIKNIKENQVKRKNVLRLKIIKERELSKTWVSLDDSRAAGNCIEGSLNFISKNFGIGWEDVLNAKWLFSIKANRLLHFPDNRVKNAINKAYERETMICI